MSERLERIERYLHGEMSEAEQVDFEQALRDDTALQAELNKMRLVDNALAVAIEDDLRGRLQAMDPASRSGSAGGKKRFLFTRWAVAASILVVIGVGVWYLIGGGVSGLEQFRDDHYLAYDYNQIRGDFAGRGTFPFELSSEDFNKEEAAAWFSGWLEEHPDDLEARYILAGILRDLDRPEDAKSELAYIIRANSILWSEKAEWNYVLLSTAGDWDALAEQTFAKILSTPAHSYHPQAMELEKLMHTK